MGVPAQRCETGFVSATQPINGVVRDAQATNGFHNLPAAKRTSVNAIQDIHDLSQLASIVVDKTAVANALAPEGAAPAL
jgi:hypothetical protein